MKRFLILITLLLIGTAAYSLTISGKGISIEGGISTNDNGMRLINEVAATESYWLTARTSYWNDARTTLWNTARNDTP